jgi:hypothetical protein
MPVIIDGTTGITTPGLTNTGTETIVNLTTTGNTILGDASTDTLNVGNGGLVKDASGNLGLGVTPSAWSGSFKATQVGAVGALWSSTGTAGSWLSRNSYFDGSAFKYLQTSFAQAYEMASDGSHKFYTAPSGTAGATATLTGAMTLDASGRLMVGVTSNINSSTVIQAGGIINARIGIDSPDSQGFYFTKSSANNGTYRVDTNGNFEWYTKNVSQAMILDVSGRLGIGPTSPSTVLHTSSSIAGIFAQGTSTKTNNYLMSCSNSYNYGVVGVVSGDNTSGGDIYALGYVASAGGSFNPVASWTSSGNLLVGTTSQPPSGTNKTVIQVDGSGNPGLNVYYTGTGAYNQIVLENGNGVVGRIQTSGSATSYLTSSDYRLKENVAPMTGALSKVAQLKPITYKWKKDGLNGQGFIAHELQEVIPDCVGGDKDAVDADGNPVYQGIDTSFLVATLTAAIQEQQALITQLTARITALEGAA